MTSIPTRNLVVVLGDQLDELAGAFHGFDADRDLVWMCESRQEATHVASHKARIAFFLAAMRHFRDRLLARGWRVKYRSMDREADPSLAEALGQDLVSLRPERVLVTRPGEYRIAEMLRGTCLEQGFTLDELQDGHFYCTPQDFDAWAKDRKLLRLEHFYRHMRKRHGVLLKDGKPVGGRWNYDADNRKSFGRQGPGMVPPPLAFQPDDLTRQVLRLVESAYPDAPGSLQGFDWPVTRQQARLALQDFVTHRLPQFGIWQDAMWQGEPFLWHARLSAALNVKLLSPREVIEAALQAHRDGTAPIASVEGFVRQILGWREYVRGLYWNQMPGYLDKNALGARHPLPAFYWSADTEYACLREVVGQVIETGYAHHIQRLMVTGLFALLLGVDPRRVHEWYLAMFVDAVEWVEAPNTLGMSQFADGGLLASKPYIASGAYIHRMSDYCRACRFNPKHSAGDQACPFTVLFWDFLIRHRERFENHPRIGMLWRNLQRLSTDETMAIRGQAESLRGRLD